MRTTVKSDTVVGPEAGLFVGVTTSVKTLRLLSGIDPGGKCTIRDIRFTDITSVDVQRTAKSLRDPGAR
jgi:hypothetical protein